MLQHVIAEKSTSDEVERIIGHIKGDVEGPTIIFFAGVHGNEIAGVKALKQVFGSLAQKTGNIQGQCIGIAGNLTALKRGVRFVEEDLNRIWLPHLLNGMTSSNSPLSVDGEEVLKLSRLIHNLIKTLPPPFYFIDLHTTSGETEPFIVMNDSLLNRSFVQHYPLPIILGIEEYLTGALLSHINEMGYVSFGFESGQHESMQAVDNAIDFVWFTLALTGFLKTEKHDFGGNLRGFSASDSVSKRFYEIYYQHLIEKDVHFKMLPGFKNFQMVPKGIPIAEYENGLIVTEQKRCLFMPLYQDKGYEGFYFIRSVPRFFLWMSKYLRKLRFDSFLVLLPGIRWASKKKEALYVDKRIARFLAKSIFHLLGYRAREVDKFHLVLRNRERNSKTSEYSTAPWHKKTPGIIPGQN